MIYSTDMAAVLDQARLSNAAKMSGISNLDGKHITTIQVPGRFGFVDVTLNVRVGFDWTEGGKSGSYYLPNENSEFELRDYEIVDANDKRIMSSEMIEQNLSDCFADVVVEEMNLLRDNCELV